MKIRSFIRFLIISGYLCVLASQGEAATVLLNSGRSVEGEIVSETDAYIVLTVSTLQVGFPKTRIKRILREKESYDESLFFDSLDIGDDDSGQEGLSLEHLLKIRKEVETFWQEYSLMLDAEKKDIRKVVEQGIRYLKAVLPSIEGVEVDEHLFMAKKIMVKYYEKMIDFQSAALENLMMTDPKTLQEVDRTVRDVEFWGRQFGKEFGRLSRDVPAGASQDGHNFYEKQPRWISQIQELASFNQSL